MIDLTQKCGIINGMTPIAEVYSKEDVSDPCDYQPLLKSFGYDIIVQVDDNDYQGDSRLLFRDGERYGVLIFGWGSCSGCDSLQACGSLQDIDELRTELFNEIIWFNSATECLVYFNTHDWEGDYSWHMSETHEFIAKCKEFFSPMNLPT